MKIHQKKSVTGGNVAMLGPSDLLRIRGGSYVGGGGSGGDPPPTSTPIPVKTPDTNGH
jgi:hypothetical protein